MPDISLLQQENYGVQEEESKIPGFISTIAFVVMIIVAGGYAALYTYDQMLVKKTVEINENIKNLNAGEVTDTVDELKKLGTQAKILKELREIHTAPTQLFLAIEQSTHPAISFNDAAIDVVNKKIKMKGTAPSAAVLARQAEIYAEDGNTASFLVENIGYGEKPAVSFQLSMDIKN
ncbi:MAG: hypothetical protein NUV61_00885 [Candidatus Azambacteria bacterium]|nr:hypothetical protein [Candidatus Azambacteria bacterium]